MAVPSDKERNLEGEAEILGMKVSQISALLIKGIGWQEEVYAVVDDYPRVQFSNGNGSMHFSVRADSIIGVRSGRSPGRA